MHAASHSEPARRCAQDRRFSALCGEMTQDDEGSAGSITQPADASQRSGILDDDDDDDEYAEEYASGNMSQDDGNLSQPGDAEYDELVQLSVNQPPRRPTARLLCLLLPPRSPPPLAK